MEILKNLLNSILSTGNSSVAHAVDVTSEDFEILDSKGKQKPFNFRVGLTGTVRVVYANNKSGSIDLLNCADGSYHPNPVVKILSTGTSASGIVAYEV